MTTSAKCPECNSTIRFDEPPGLGELITCPECETELEVVRKNPLKLDWAYEEEYEEDDFEYDDLDDEDLDFDEDWESEEDWEDFEEEDER